MRSLPALSVTLSSLFFVGAALIGCGARTTLDLEGGGGHGGNPLPSGGGGFGEGAGPIGGFGGFIAEGGSGGGGAPPVDATIISQMPGSFFEGETDVKSAPNGYVAAAWIGVDDQLGTSFIGYAFSTDDGETWEPPQIAFTPGGKLASDPVITVDGENGFWMTWVSYEVDGGGNLANMVVQVAHASPFATSFDPPVDAGVGDTFDIRDKPWITFSPDGALIVTYAEFTQTSFDMIAVRSFDGINFERSVMAHDPGAVQRNLAFPCTSPDGGPIYVVWIALDNTGTKVEATRSDDLGATWSPPVRVSPVGHSVAFSDPNCSVDPENGALLVSYGQTDDPFGKEAGFTAMLFSVEIALSTNGALSFEPLTSIPVEPNLAMLPQLGFELGQFFVSYYQGQFEEDTEGQFVLSTTISVDTGFDSQTVAAPELFTPQRASAQWLGDYTGMHVRNGAAYMTFVHNEVDGLSHVAFAKR